MEIAVGTMAKSVSDGLAQSKYFDTTTAVIENPVELALTVFGLLVLTFKYPLPKPVALSPQRDLVAPIRPS